MVSKNYSKLISSALIETSSPSNIAIVKYWGKTGEQIPMNPSISFTLSESKTILKLKASLKKEKQSSLKVIFEGKEKLEFIPKISKFLQRSKQFVPLIEEYDFVFESENTFPHSSGIASSASSMSAIAKALVELEVKCGVDFTEKEKLQKISFLARLGSGSACRSVYPKLVSWGENEVFQSGSNLYASEVTEVHPVFETFCDTILLIHKGVKKVSSTVGHDLMNNHPFKELRIQEANKNYNTLVEALKTGDLKLFGEICEKEALSLHALMMTSTPSFILMLPGTLEAIQSVWDFREKTGLDLYFTLDAGANIHLLYPESQKSEIITFIEDLGKKVTQNSSWIHDKVQR